MAAAAVTQIFFDLDGTLTDSKEGIWRSIHHAMTVMGHPLTDDRDLTPCLGPPLPRCFEALLGTSDAAVIEAAIAAYRQRFERIGMFENQIYPGVVAALQALQQSRRLHVLTAKPQGYAEIILEHFDLRRFFDSVNGPLKEDRQFSKGQRLADLLHTYDVPPDRAALVGDRRDDIVAAKTANVRAIGAAWGYGGRSELETAGADAIASVPADLLTILSPP